MFVDYPYVGSPTKTLLRLFQPLDVIIQIFSNKIQSVEATGGVYKKQNLIHCSILKKQLLDIPLSRQTISITYQTRKLFQFC